MRRGLFTPSEPEGPSATLEGVLERITFTNEENGWSVVKLSVPGRPDLVTVVGNLLGVQPGESLRLSGRWVEDRKYGEQFKAESCVTIHPATLTGIQRYLGSGLVRGIGPVLAERLVAQFGLATLDVIDQTPERMGEVEGIGPVRVGRIKEAWVEQRGIKDVMVFLQSQGISTSYSVKIYKQYRERAIAVVREDPFRLAADIFGIGFRTADRIASGLGVPKDAPRRIEAAILHVLGESSDEGHVYFPRAELVVRTAALLMAGVVDAPPLGREAARASGREAMKDQELATADDRPEERGAHRRDGEENVPDAQASDPAGAAGPASPSGAVAAMPPRIEAMPLLVESAIDRMASDGRIVLDPLAGGSTPKEIGEGTAVYLRTLHAAETGAASLIGALLDAPARPIAIDVERALAWFEDRAKISLAGEQKEAIRRAIVEKVLVVTGGPGTGKTTLVNGIIAILERKGRRIALGAPTGRAAKRLQEATSREAKTIHRLLEFSPKTGGFQRDRGHPLDADVVILDEASMIDTLLAFSLLRAVPAHAQLVVVGDVDQIPSVGPGSVLGDLIRSQRVPVVRLSEIFRQARSSLIVEAAHRVNRGELPSLEPPAGDADFFFVAREEPEDLLAAIKELVSERIPRKFGMDPREEIQVLTPMHRGLLGAASLNAELQALLNPSGPALTRGNRVLRTGDKVMQVRNNYDLEVFNGDIGRIATIDDDGRRVLVRFEERVVEYDYEDLDELVLSYACSIHKAQGSEYPCVVIPLHTQHYVMLRRNLLYTAITRGKRLVVIAGSRRALAIAVRNARVAPRYTRLAERLAAAAARGSG